MYVGFFINLDRSADRRAVMEGELAKAGLQYTRFAAADGNSQGFPPGRLTAAEIGCFTSHYLLLKGAGGHDHVHVLEDDVVFCRHSRPAMEWVATSGLLDRFDIVFTDAFVQPGQLRELAAKFERACRGSTVTFSLEPYVAGTSSYLVNRRSVAKVVRLYEKALIAGPRRAIDLTMRDLVGAGQLAAVTLFPFVTSVRALASTVDEGRRDRETERLMTRARQCLSLATGVSTAERSAVIAQIEHSIASGRFRAF